MRDEPNIAAVAALIGDTARAAMLLTLVDGRALPAGELAAAAGLSPPAASVHLAKLTDGGLLTVEPEGRHRYYRLAGPGVASTLESLACLIGQSSPSGATRRPQAVRSDMPAPATTTSPASWVLRSRRRWKTARSPRRRESAWT
jgi:DNA-binding transcriptional ArsR family regulator